jgi:hypothetical protein
MRIQRGWLRFLWTIFAGVGLCGAALLADPVTLEKPLYSEVFVRSTTNANNEKVAGNLLRYDEQTLTIKTSKGERDLRWTDLTGTSAYALKSRLIDKNNSHDWLELGRFAWSMNAKEQARTALAAAQKLDASLKSEASSIVATEPGSAIKADQAASTKDKKGEAPGPATAPAAGAAPAAAAGGGPAAEGGAPSLPPSQSGGRVGRDKLVKYQKSTPDQDAAAMAAARRLKDEFAQRLKINFTELTTDHFIIFTDWDKREFGFLKDNLEGAYACVSQQFEIPVRENVFVGKLPVFMFAKQADFKRFANLCDSFSPGDGVAGYYSTTSSGNGVGHMAMWKPDPTKSGGDIHKAEIDWAYVLTHEFTHAFVARYRSNERVPRWLNEGVAEVIANQKFPRMGVRPFARMMASKASDSVLMNLFDDERMPGGEMYPVMMTIVETLINRDKRAFLAYFDDLKAGTDPEEALKKYYHLDNASLIGAWKQYVMSHQ